MGSAVSRRQRSDLAPLLTHELTLNLAGISRLDYQRTHGWLVRMKIDGRIRQKVFSDRPSGGRDKALRRAMALRDDWLRQCGNDTDTHRQWRPYGRVVLIDRKDWRTEVTQSGAYQREVHTYVWRALLWHVDRQYSKQFSVHRYGYDQAHAMAVEALREMNRRVDRGLPPYSCRGAR